MCPLLLSVWQKCSAPCPSKALKDMSKPAGWVADGCSQHRAQPAALNEGSRICNNPVKPTHTRSPHTYTQLTKFTRRQRNTVQVVDSREIWHTVLPTRDTHRQLLSQPRKVGGTWLLPVSHTTLAVCVGTTNVTRQAVQGDAKGIQARVVAVLMALHAPHPHSCNGGQWRL